MLNKLHYIFDSRAPQSPARPLQDLIVQKRMPLTVEDGFNGHQIILAKRLLIRGGRLLKHIGVAACTLV